MGGVASEIKADGQDNMRRIESAATNAVKNLGKDEKSGKHTGATQVKCGGLECGGLEWVCGLWIVDCVWVCGVWGGYGVLNGVRVLQ